MTPPGRSGGAPGGTGVDNRGGWGGVWAHQPADRGLGARARCAPTSRRRTLFEGMEMRALAQPGVGAAGDAARRRGRRRFQAAMAAALIACAVPPLLLWLAIGAALHA